MLAKLRVIGTGLCWVVAALVMRLNIVCIAIIVLFSLLFSFIFEKYYKLERENEKDYYELTAYMEQLLCSYKRWGNLHAAMEDCVILFDRKTKIGIYILNMLERLNNGENDFTKMEKRYASKRLKIIHDFILKAEQMGGEIGDAIDILLKDLHLWKKRVEINQKKKKYLLYEVIIATGLAFLFCVIARTLVSKLVVGVSMFELVYQITSVFLIGLFMIICLIVMKKLSFGWIGNSKKKSMDLQMEFSFWLLGITLSLQQESVYQAITESYDSLEGVFKDEVKKLMDGLYDSPTSLQPYISFFEQRKMPEISTGMRLLYSIDANGYKDMEKSARALVEQINDLLAESEKNLFDRQIAGFGMIKLLPLTLAGAKIAVDIFVIVIAALEKYQNFLS